MRWLLLGSLALVSCDVVRAPCNSALLGGTCAPVDGTWLLQSEARTTCARELFDGALVLQHPGNGNLIGTAGSTSFFGVLFPEGEFQLYSSGEERHFMVHGQLHRPPAQSDQLRGDVSYLAGDECNGISRQFVGRRE